MFLRRFFRLLGTLIFLDWTTSGSQVSAHKRVCNSAFIWHVHCCWCNSVARNLMWWIFEISCFCDRFFRLLGTLIFLDWSTSGSQVSAHKRVCTSAFIWHVHCSWCDSVACNLMWWNFTFCRVTLLCLVVRTYLRWIWEMIIICLYMCWSADM